MAIPPLKDLIEAGVHFGSRTSRWNPKMAPFIHSKRSGVHVIDLKETLTGLIRAAHFLRGIVSKGGKILFVGTKRQASEVIRKESIRCRSFFVANRWLGGTLTNMQTMRHRVNRLEELEALEDTGQIQDFSKKMISSLTRERRKIHRNFEGIRDMKKLPQAIVVVDPRQEHIAVHEAIKLGIPTLAIVDTDSDPEPIDFVVPGNDDSARSLEILLQTLGDAIIEGKQKSSGAAPKAALKTQDEAPESGIDVPENIGDVGSFSFGGDEAGE